MFTMQSIFKSFKSHILVVIRSFFEFGTVSKWCIREWVTPDHHLMFTKIPSVNSGWLMRYSYSLTCKKFNPFPNNNIYSSNLKDFADVNFKFVKHGKKPKEELFLTSNFYFSQCFQKTCTSDT